MKFKDVAYLYIGCKIQTKEGIGTFNSLDVKNTGGNPKDWEPISSFDLVDAALKFKQVKPILRPISSVRESEWKEIERLQAGLPPCSSSDFRGLYTRMSLERRSIEIHYLVQRSVDLFQLIEAGEAIDGTLLEDFKFEINS